MPIAVIGDEEFDGDRPDIFIKRPPVLNTGCKPAYMMESPFQSTLYLDTDTVVARDITDLFGLLEWYDFGVSFVGPQLNGSDGLRFHSWPSSGVMLFLNNNRVDTMFAIWHAEFKRQQRLNKKGNDERALAEALAKSSVRYTALAEYCNFALFQTIVTYSPPLIYHGRFPEMEKLDSIICANWNVEKDHAPRLWLQNIRGILPNGVRRSDPLLGIALLLRRTLNLLRYRYVK